jgi:hypothetical protein
MSNPISQPVVTPKKTSFANAQAHYLQQDKPKTVPQPFVPPIVASLANGLFLLNSSLSGWEILGRAPSGQSVIEGVKHIDQASIDAMRRAGTSMFQ